MNSHYGWWTDLMSFDVINVGLVLNLVDKCCVVEGKLKGVS
mgnify:CR=1 FL=1